MGLWNAATQASWVNLRLLLELAKGGDFHSGQTSAIRGKQTPGAPVTRMSANDPIAVALAAGNQLHKPTSHLLGFERIQFSSTFFRCSSHKIHSERSDD